jgi:anthranilate phosphoribosyltransferase
VLGPLVNPLLPRRQFIGTAFAELMDVIFDTAIKMGKDHVIVVRGRDGLDEISVSAPTRVLEYRDGQKYDYDIRPEDFGIETLPFEAVSAASPEACLAIARSIIDGTVSSEHYKLVAANAAFIYTKLIEPMPLPAAYRKMERLILDGELRDVLERYVAVLSSETVPAEMTKE